MNFTAQTVPYHQTGYFSRLITDYLSGDKFLKSFYEHPVSFAGIDAAIQNRENFPTDRGLLVKILVEQYKNLPVRDSVLENLAALSKENSFTITTAHQPAIFTGHLYFIYKILHVIKIAELLSGRYPDRRFIPVYYMGSEDADLEELGQIYLDKEKLTWETDQGGAVGRMSTDGLEKIISRIEGEYSGAPYGQELIQLLKDCYLRSNNIQEATLKILHHLFGQKGLIILVPDNAMLKSTMRAVFRDDLTNHIPFELISNNIKQLSTKYPAQANPREINLFYLKENIRERLEIKNGLYHVFNTNIHFTREELLEELDRFPERFSPNVILRGLYQETILPNIVFVGGGGETAYWLELKPLFQQYHIPYPVLILRNSFLLIRNNWRKKLEKAGLSTADVFQSEEKWMEDFVRLHSSRQLNLDIQQTEMKQVYSSIKNISGQIDKTLVQHVDKLETQTLRKLEELEKKIIRAEKKNHEEVRKKIYEIREGLFPLGNLQERLDNFIPWYANYGMSFFDLIYQHSLTLEQSFVILKEEN